MSKALRRISRRAVGSTVFRIIDFDHEFVGRELELLVRREVEAWLCRYDGYEVLSVSILEEPEDDVLGTALVVHEKSFVRGGSRLIANPDLWDVDITQSFQGSLRFVTGKL